MNKAIVARDTPLLGDELRSLNSVLQHKVPNATLSVQGLPMVPTIKLALIEQDYPQAELSASQVQFLMDNPPYWGFCWASGQVLARFILDKPDTVKNMNVVDFGCGSGVVAIAAKLAGAKRVIAVDLDQSALDATRLNAHLNEVSIETTNNLNNLPFSQENACLLIADVFYDEHNLPMLADFIAHFDDLIIADSRVKPERLNGVDEVKRYNSCTVPDLDESSSFNNVGVYRRKA